MSIERHTYDLIGFPSKERLNFLVNNFLLMCIHGEFTHILNNVVSETCYSEKKSENIEVKKTLRKKIFYYLCGGHKSTYTVTKYLVCVCLLMKPRFSYKLVCNARNVFNLLYSQSMFM